MVVELVGKGHEDGVRTVNPGYCLSLITIILFLSHV